MADQQQEQYEEQHRRWYAEWVRKQYDGPGCRAKIVGRAKYEQIVRAVRGELRRAAENSKFRFWVRAKGFRMGRPTSSGAAVQSDDSDVLYVVDTRNGGTAVAATAQTGSGSRQQQQQKQFSYKKVAVVDEFFDIIYRVHCSGGGVSARHSGQKRTHRMIMETYAFLPREAVTAFLMGCPQCSTSNTTSASTVDASVENLQQTPLAITNVEYFHCANVDQWSSSKFACSTPVKQNEESSRAVKSESTSSIHPIVATDIAMGADKENVTDNECQIAVTASTKCSNKRKRTVPLKRNIRQPCQVIEVATAATTTVGNSSSGSSTLKNSSNSSCTLILSSSSSSLSSRTESGSGVSKSSGGWWSKWGVCSNSSKLSVSVGGSDFSGVNSNMQPLDLSSSPLLTVSPTQTTIRSLSSPSVVADDFFYKRKRVRRRRVRPKRLNRLSLSRRGGNYEDDDTSMSDDGDGDYKVIRNSYRDSGNDNVGSCVNEEADGNITDEQNNAMMGEKVEDGGINEEYEGPKPAKIQRRLGEGIVNRKNNNNDDDFYDKAASVVTVAAINCCDGEIGQKIAENALSRNMVMEKPLEVQKEFTEIDRIEVDESDENQEKSAALHSPINKRINGTGHHPYNMHHTSRSIMNGLATSSSPSSLAKSLDTITTSSNSHHNFHRHWLDMANDSVNNSNMMDVDGSADDNSMAAAAAAAAAALLFSPPSSVGSGISPGGPLSSLHPNSHLAHHHALSPLAPLALPPHSAAGIGLTPAHHHHHQHIQQQLQQYAAAAVAAATAAAAAAAAASSTGDSTSPPPNLPLSLPPMAHHYNQNNNISGTNKRRSTSGTGLTVQQQLYRRSGTPTSSTTSSPSPRLLNSKNDADTTTSSTGLHENSSFSTSGLPTTTTTVLWPPLGLLTAAHQQHHHSMQSPPKFQQLFGSSVNSLATVTAGSQVLPSLPPPPISSPSSSYRLPSKETNGMAVTTSNGAITGNDIGIGTGAENAMNAEEDDAAVDDDEDEEDEEDEEEEEEDLDDDDIEEGEEDADEEEGERNADGGDGNGAQTRRLRRQQVRRLRQLQRASNGNNNANDGTDSGITTSYRQHWQQPSTTTTSASSLSQQQHQHSVGSSSQHHIDPERLKAFNMFVRLFVDENLDRQVPISRQPKDKVQAIIDSCGRQFPELSDRSRKRIRTYLKSCRRNKRNTPQSGGVVSSSPPPPTNPWPANGSSSDPTVQPQRPTPAHLTSAQAETILAVACQRESDNARRMRLGLEPVAQPYPYSVASTSTSNVFQQPSGTLLLNQNGSGGATLQMSSTSSDEDAGVGDSSFEKTSTNVIEADTKHRNGNDEAENRDGCDRQEVTESVEGGSGGDSANMTNTVNDELNLSNVTSRTSVTSSSPNNNETAGPTDLSVNKSFSATTHSMGTSTMTAIPPAPTGGGFMSGAGFRGLSTSTSTTTVNHRRISSNNSSSATGMLQLFPTMNTTSSISSGTTPTLPIQPSMLNQTTPPVQPSSKLLNKADVVTVRQLIAGYRESAAFLLRSADELEHLLLLRG